MASRLFELTFAELEETNSRALAELQDKLVLPNHEHVMQLHQLFDTLNTTFTFKITNCQRKREAGGIFTSQPFYTSHGYRMVIEVHLNCRDGAFVSIFVYLVAGRSDSQLSWLFVGEITFMLMNQLLNYYHRCKTLIIPAQWNMRVGGAKLGFPDFISQELCYNPGENLQFLVDDTLCFRISVRESKPWLVCSSSD